MFQILRRSNPESISGLITPNKYSAIRGKHSHHKELRSNSTIITTFILFNSYGVGGNLLHPPSWDVKNSRLIFGKFVPLLLN